MKEAILHLYKYDLLFLFDNKLKVGTETQRLRVDRGLSNEESILVYYFFKENHEWLKKELNLLNPLTDTTFDAQQYVTFNYSPKAINNYIIERGTAGWDGLCTCTTAASVDYLMSKYI